LEPEGKSKTQEEEFPLDSLANRFKERPWANIIIFVLLIPPLIVMLLVPLLLFVPLGLFEGAENRAPAAEAIISVVLASFTLLLWILAVITALFARNQLASAIQQADEANRRSKADFTLRLHDTFHNERTLRIRHGAATFLLRERGVKGWRCDKDISPYSDQGITCGLSTDLIEIFSFFDRIAYLIYKSKVLDKTIEVQKYGTWVKYYYDACKPKIDEVQLNYPYVWPDLERFHNEVNDWMKDHPPPRPLSSPREEEQRLNDFLIREHTRSHRSTDEEGPLWKRLLSRGLGS
jgi:hypothetical protein